jgi:hypothetical protein
MDSRDVAKVIALKAYLVAKQATSHEHKTLAQKAERAVRALTGRDTPESMRRRVFYNLVLAELFRERDPIPYRTAAMDDGERLAALGLGNPAAIYMRIVEATTERVTTAHFGDFNSSPCWSHSWWSDSPLAESLAFQGSIGPALAAVQLEDSLAEQYDKFLVGMSLDEIMKEHEIA